METGWLLLVRKALKEVNLAAEKLWYARFKDRDGVHMDAIQLS